MRHSIRSRCLPLVCAVACVTPSAGCVRHSDVGVLSVGPEGRIVRVIRPPGKWAIYSMTWVRGQRRLVLAADTRRPFLTPTLFSVTIAGGQWRRVADLQRRRCRGTIAVAPTATGSNTLAYIEGCLRPDIPPGESKHIKEFSFDSRETRLLFSYGLPWPAGAFALHPYGRIGVLNDGRGLFEQLRWLRPQRLSAPIALGIERLGSPAWSPDGRFIAFPGAVGISTKTGSVRSIADWRIHVASGKLEGVKLAASTTFEEDAALSWSPDSRYIAAASVGRKRLGKVLLLRPSVRKHRLLLTGNYGAVTWVGNTTVAAVRIAHPNSLSGGDYIELIDVRHAMQSLN